MPFDLFTPFGSNSTAVSVSGTTASGSLGIPSASTDLSGAPGTGATRSANYGGVSVRVYNSTTVIVFIQFGNSAVTATTSNMPIPPGVVETFQIGPSVTHVAGITGGTTGTLYATIGMGA